MLPYKHRAVFLIGAFLWVNSEFAVRAIRNGVQCYHTNLSYEQCSLTDFYFYAWYQTVPLSPKREIFLVMCYYFPEKFMLCLNNKTSTQNGSISKLTVFLIKYIFKNRFTAKIQSYFLNAQTSSQSKQICKQVNLSIKIKTTTFVDLKSNYSHIPN